MVLWCFSSRWFCLSGLNTTVTLRQNAFFEFASIQRSAPRLKPPKHFCVVLAKLWIQNGLSDYFSCRQRGNASSFTRCYTQYVIKWKEMDLRERSWKPMVCRASIKDLIKYVNTAMGRDPQRIETFTLLINHSK